MIGEFARGATGGHQHLDHPRIDDGPATRDLADGIDELVDVGHALLEEIGTSAGAFLEQGECVLGLGVLAEHDNADLRAFGPETLGGPQPFVGPRGWHADIVEQGAEGHEMYVLLDGVLSAEVDGTSVAQVGPGAVLGERALLEGGRRTATLRAVTPCKVAKVTDADLDPELLSELAAGHRREEDGGG